MKNIKNFIEENKIKMTCEYADHNPNMDDKNWQANHYKITLKTNGKQFTLYFSQGIGITGEPKIESVLDCLASDAAGYENASDFEDWANEYGYDTDSRKAEKTYNLIGKQADKLKNLLGEDNYNTLLWDTERE